MKTIDLSYLDIPRDSPLQEILRAYGEQISSGTYNMVSYVLTSTKQEDELKAMSFYLIAPELNKQHQLLRIDILDVANLSVKLWPLSIEKFDQYNINYFANDYSQFDDKIGDILNSVIVKQIISFYVSGVKFKREVRGS